MQITPTEFQETINEINEILVNAYSLTRSFMDHTLAILTLYLSMLVIDKNLKPLMQLADRHYVVEKGCIAWSGTSAELAGANEIMSRYLSV